MKTKCNVNKLDCKGEKPRRYAACAVCWGKFGTLDKLARETGKFVSSAGKNQNNPLGGSLRRYRS